MTEIEEDFLEVDAPINGQRYVLLSFVSPEKFLKRKEIFSFHKYLKHSNKDYDLTFEDFEKKWTNFMYSNEQNIEDEFSELVDFRTSVRGLKIRGSYDTYREAKVKAARLQKVDRAHHVFIGQVGYWMPWDPTPDAIEDQEYLNSQLNTLVHEYKKNQQYRDEVFGDRVQQSKEDAAREVEEHRQRQEAEQAEQDDIVPTVVEGTTIESSDPEASNQTMTTSETASGLEGDDPWLQRKKEGTTNVIEV
tara:strand:- start:31 stop:774 length:744 start_codon:yes stop_codon:yes gene_type:complete